eukprot:gene10370-12125_t
MGAIITANIPVTPGEVLYIYVGGQGSTSTGGFNGGGAAGGYPTGSSGGTASSGGAAGSTDGSAGTQGIGGSCTGSYGAGGGGGWWGGGGGYGAGGGGSSYSASGVVSSGVSSIAGHGSATLSWVTTNPTFIPTVAPAGFLSEPGDTDSKVNETVFILLYVLGGLTALYGLYRASLCYAEAMKNQAWKRRMREHLHEVQVSLAGQPARIPNLKAVRIKEDKPFHAKDLVFPAPFTPNDAFAVPNDGDVRTNLTNGIFLNAEEALEYSQLSSGSSSSSSITLSSLHSSEISSAGYSAYSPNSNGSLEYYQCSENFMEEGRTIMEEVDSNHHIYSDDSTEGSGSEDGCKC